MISKLSNKGYVIKKDKHRPSQIKKIKKELNVSPYSPYNNPMVQSVKYPVYLESVSKLYLPRWWGLENLGQPEKFDITPGFDIDLKFNGTLRPVQKEAKEAFMKNCFSDYGGGIICLGCGFGKTALSLNIIAELKKKALVIVHKEFLLNQWIDRIGSFLPGTEVGRIQAKTFDVAGKDIVIGMLQTLSQKDFPEDAFESFGTLVVDECHHISSETFSRALPKTAFKYTIGLTATPNRMDGLTKVFEWFLGPIVYKSKNRQGQSVFVKVLDYRNDDEDYCRAEVGFDGKLVNARMVNNVTNCGARTNMIIEEIKKIMEEAGRKMLILSDRREHLKNINDILVELGFDTGFYLGGMKQKDLDISETKPIILGTFSMSSEALDIPELNTLFMTCPKSNIEQSVGRILRKEHDIKPLIIDVKDDFAPFSNQFKKRKAYYKKCKYDIKEIVIESESYKKNIEDNKNIHNTTICKKIDFSENIVIETKKKKKQNHLKECFIDSDED